MKTALGILLAVLVVLGYNSLYVVGEGQHALVLQFGRILRTDVTPGLHAKLPLLQQVLPLDQRVLAFDGQPARYTTDDKQSVNVDYYVKWRIADDAAYYRATGGDELQAGQRLGPLVVTALRAGIGQRKLQALIADQQGQLTAAAIKDAGAQARQTLGVELVDVRITGVSFPDDLRDAVYKRMQSERQQDAASIRAEGKLQAESVKADAARQASVIRAQAESAADKVKGEGDAQATQIYAQAYADDPDFFAFYRSLEAYRKAFGNGQSTIVLKPDAEFLRYFSNPTPAPHH